MPPWVRHGRRLEVFALTLVIAVVVTGAWAYFASTGTGTAAGASIGSVGAPVNVTAQAAGTNVTVDWAAATLSWGGLVDAYRFTLPDGPTICGSPSLLPGLSCIDTNVPAGTYTYTVTAVFHTFTTPASSGSSVTVSFA